MIGEKIGSDMWSTKYITKILKIAIVIYCLFVNQAIAGSLPTDNPDLVISGGRSLEQQQNEANTLNAEIANMQARVNGWQNYNAGDLEEIDNSVTENQNIDYKDKNAGNKKDICSIPIGARIIAVADVYDAIITDRPYRKGKPPWEAVEEIEKNSGTQFDPEIVKAFKRVIASKLEAA